MTTRLNSVLRGSLAGLAATAAMSIVMLAGKRIGALGEPPPRRLTRRLLAPLGSRAPSGARLDAAALAAHFGFGASMGAIWGLLPQRLHGATGGALFGLAVWATNYAGWIPAAGLMPPPNRDRPARPTTMILAHLIYGSALAAFTRREPVLADARSSPLLSSSRKGGASPSGASIVSR